MKSSSLSGIVLASLLAAIVGSLATVALRSATAAAGPQTVTGSSAVALANSADAKIQGLETRVSQLEQKLAALKTTYEGHGHGYLESVCGTRMNLTNFKQALAQQPDAYMICISPVGHDAARPAMTGKPAAGP